jgi:ATP-dependent exoDNAse (exonuclease V) beta subunit
MLTGVYETLRSAGRPLTLEIGGRPQLAERVEELREAARCLAEDGEATDNQRTAATQLLATLERGAHPDRLFDLSGFKTRATERAATYEDARRAVEQSAFDTLAAHDRDLLQQLLEHYAGAFDEAKARESALDFEDLQLRARDLLKDNETIRERESLRFRSIMVDEFQDTNQLQCDLVDLLRRPETEVFYVGDEFQSIYGFRHADVGVFRERRAQAAQLLPLTNNYRSRPEVLAAVNHLFGSHFGSEFQPLAAAADYPDPVFGHPVELLVTDKPSYADSGVHWRRGEALAIARRVRELVEAGVATPGEIVLLFAAGTDAEWYEDELRKTGLPTYRATGKGYFGQQQVADLLAYLRLLHNRYDDRALVSVLASPFVGVSNDALALIRRVASKRPLFSGIEHSLPPQLADRDARLLRAFRQRFDRLVEAMARSSLERLCERIVSEHDYDLAVLAQWDGRRRYANMRKLARLARSYEELRGPDVEGFVRFVAEQEALGARELEAVAEEEGADAVRLLTIHAAKGLEFKVVIVADAGRDKAPPSADEILALADGRFGFRVADPVTTKRRGAFDYEEIKESRKAEEDAEKLRLYYVAMTRAKERLIVSGAIDREKTADANTPIGWVLGRLDADEELTAAGEAPLEIERGDARLVVRVDRYRPAQVVAEAAVVEAGQLALFAELAEAVQAAAAPVLPPLVAPAEPPLHRPRRLSFTALSTFDQCSYKYYAIYVAGMRERRAELPAGGDGGLRATEIGDAVHKLLEAVDLAAPATPDLEQVRVWYPTVSVEELERIRGFVESYCGSELARRVAAFEGMQKERHFTFEHDGVLLHGFVDAMHLDGETALVVDYKTNLLGDASPDEIVEHDYRLQRLVYALACFRAGAERVEVVYHFLERADAVVSTTFVRDQVATLEAELTAGIERIKAGEFRPTPSDFTCAGCPALDLVCAGPRLRSVPPELQLSAS